MEGNISMTTNNSDISKSINTNRGFAHSCLSVPPALSQVSARESH